MLKTPLCHQIGISYPIFSAGMGPAAGPELAAAVSSAGGCGVLGGLFMPPPILRQAIHRLRSLTDKPFGVNFVLSHLQEGQIEVCLEEQVPLLVLFWGDPSPYIAEAHRHHTKVFTQVGSVEEATAAADAGVDAIIVQGVEAGGHVKGLTSLSTIVPAVVEAVNSVPAIAAGGIATGRGVVSALSLGAQAVSMGTRFLCSTEAAVMRAYQERVVSSTAKDTVYTTLFDVGWPGAPHRVLRNTAFVEWESAGYPASGQRPGEGKIAGTVSVAGTTIEVPKYGAMIPLTGFSGDMESVALYAGESCSLVNDIKPAAQIVQEVVKEAEETIAHMQR
ncbi:NAD(P)H-dependent flavin oxidoreductase [Mastigocladopsis repens]|uniref:NAD(P)H-dependent flavin oxidoreductase n=1 Tax=Mastigocladopsis repens TaxID=221287 RepID=UPI0002E0B5EA|nr:nitronate monooxygenase [Mastigocladopsis repens]